MKKLFILIFGLFAVLFCFGFSTNVYASDVELPLNSTPYYYLSLDDFAVGNYDITDINNGRSVGTHNRYISSNIIEATPNASYRFCYKVSNYTQRVITRCQYFDSNKVYLDTIVTNIAFASTVMYFEFTLPDYVSYMFISVQFSQAPYFTDNIYLTYANLFRVTGSNDPSPIAWYNTALILADPYQVGVNYFFTFVKDNKPWDGTGNYDTFTWNNKNIPLLYLAGTNSEEACYSYGDGQVIDIPNFDPHNLFYDTFENDGRFDNFVERMFYKRNQYNFFTDTWSNVYYHLKWLGDDYVSLNSLLYDIFSACWENGGSNIAYVSWDVNNTYYGSYYFGISTNLTLSVLSGSDPIIQPTDSTYIGMCSIIHPNFVLPNYYIGLSNASFRDNNPYASMFWIGMIDKTNSDIVSYSSITNNVASSYALPYEKVLNRLYDIYDFAIYSKIIGNASFRSYEDWTYSYTLYIPLYNSYTNFYSSSYNPLIDFRARLWNEVIPPAFGTFEPTDTSLWRSWTDLYHLVTSVLVYVTTTGYFIADINPIYTYIIVLFFVVLCLDMIRRFNVF